MYSPIFKINCKIPTVYQLKQYKSTSPLLTLTVASSYLRYVETHPEYYPLTQIDEATIFCQLFLKKV